MSAIIQSGREYFLGNNAIGDFVRETSADITTMALSALVVTHYAPDDVCVEHTLKYGAIAVLSSSVMHAALLVWKDKLSEKEYTYCQYTKVYCMAAYICLTVGLWIHELGHADLGELVFCGSSIIILYPFDGGGKAGIIDRRLCGIGPLLGTSQSQLLLTAGGPLADVAVTVSGIAYHYFKNHEMPKTAKTAVVISGITAFNRCYNAIDAFHDNGTNRSDYTDIAKLTGVSAMVFAYFWAILPLITLEALERIYPKEEKSSI